MSENKRGRWEEAQRRELDYVETGKCEVWGTPHSLSYWKMFLHLGNIDGCGVDVGCGHLGISNFAPNIIGVDPIDYSYMCKNFIQGMGEDLPFEDKSVDFVICCNALDHCMDPQKVVDEMFRISDRVILWVNVYPRIVGWIMKIVDKSHPYHFTTEDVYNFLESHSCVITKKYVKTFLDVHLKHTPTPFPSFKLLVAHILGVRVLGMHVEITEESK